MISASAAHNCLCFSGCSVFDRSLLFVLQVSTVDVQALCTVHTLYQYCVFVCATVLYARLLLTYLFNLFVVHTLQVINTSYIIILHSFTVTSILFKYHSTSAHKEDRSNRAVRVKISLKLHPCLRNITIPLYCKGQ